MVRRADVSAPLDRDATLLAPCVDDVTLGALLGGSALGGSALGARSSEALAHVRTCARCRARLLEGTVAAQETEAPVSVLAPPTARNPLQPGTVIAGRYRIDHLLGAGGMGMVFDATQLDLGRRVAIKVLLPEHASDGVALTRFEREARLASLLVSEHTVTIHELGRLETGEPFLVMERLEGEDLGAVVDRGPVAVEVALGWMLAVCKAIGEAHALGIVHRDLKPENLFLATTAAGEGRIKVLDFGLAKLRHATSSAASTGFGVTSQGIALGSPLTMAPEQIGGARDVDARADVWALGVTFYMLVTGGPPFDGADVFELFGQIRTRPAPSLRSVTGPAIAGVIDRCLAKDPGGRPRDASELGAELARARSAAPAVQASLTATLDGASGPPPRTAIMAPLRSASSAPVARPPSPVPTPSPSVSVGPPGAAWPVPRAAPASGSSPVGIAILAVGLCAFVGVVAAIVLVFWRARASDRAPLQRPTASPIASPFAAPPELDATWVAEVKARLVRAKWTLFAVPDEVAFQTPTCAYRNVTLVGQGGSGNVLLGVCRSADLAAAEGRRSLQNSVFRQDGVRFAHCGAARRHVSERICEAAIP